MPSGGMIAGSIAAPIIGGVLGNLLGGGDRDKAQGYNQQALEAITGLSLPTVQEQQIALQKLVSSGQLTPEMLQTLTQSDSKLNDIQEDPRLKQAQMNALATLAKTGEQGMTDSDRAALDASRRSVDQDVQAKNQSILQSMQQRGMGGAGAELAAQLSNSQAGADRASQESDRIAAMAQQNALQATMNSGTLGGQVRAQDYGEKSAAAQAQDAINRFNSQNAQNVAATNVSAHNNAQQYNLSNAQRISDTNTGLANQQEMYNKGLIGQNYDRQAQKAGMMANAYGNAANTAMGQANATQGMWAGVGQGVGQGAATLGAYGLKYGSKTPSSDSYNPTGNSSTYDLAQRKDGPVDLSGYNYAHGGMAGDSDIPLMRYMNGGQVPGKAEHPGDDPRNDVIDAKLSKGEIIVPNSIVNSSDEAILDFIKHVKRAHKR